MSIEIILLGTAQDAGVPQIGCDCPTCQRARRDPAQRHWVVCLALVDHNTRQSWLIDATPDIREQVDTLRKLVPDCPLSGILLTHAHMGHYTGLLQVGPEAMNAQGLPVYATAAMNDFLQHNLPWSQLVEGGHLNLQPLTPGKEFSLTPNLHVRPMQVPHRDEFSDTLAFVVRSSNQQLFYCPDIDAWDQWAYDLRTFVIGMNVALLDGSFFSPAELPGRDIRQIPHPLVTDTARRLKGVACEVHFIHLNHSNPLLNADSSEYAWLTAQGFDVGQLGQRWVLR